MKKLDVCPMEDTVFTLMDFLVSPLIPLKSSARDNPRLSVQEEVAKQIHAVVILYNYYHRKYHSQSSELDFLDLESFCKLAVNLNKSLLGFMKHTRDGSDNLEKKLSVTEEMIKGACALSASLDAAKDSTEIDNWPISKVAIFLVDSGKEKCYLDHHTIMKGIWSPIEKDVDILATNTEGPMKGKMKRTYIRRNVKDSPNESSFRPLAFVAVKEATGIDQSNLEILEIHVSYSLSKEKSAALFYIMQCKDKGICKVPIEDAINSLQGPLLKKDSGLWSYTPVVEYFHLLPYEGMLSEWLSSRKTSSISLPKQLAGSEIVKFTEPTEKPCKPKLLEQIDGFKPINGTDKRIMNKRKAASLTSSKTTCTDLSLMVLPDGCEPSYIVDHDVLATFPVHQIGEKCKDITTEMKLNSCQALMLPCIRRSETNSSSSDETIFKLLQWIFQHLFVHYNSNQNNRGYLAKKSQGVVLHLVELPAATQQLLTGISDQLTSTGEKSLKKPRLEIKRQNPTKGGAEIFCDGNKNGSQSSSDQVRMIDTVTAFRQLNYDALEKIQTTFSSKNALLSQAALKALLHKKNRLSLGRRCIDDEIAEVENDMKTIQDDENDNLDLKIDCVIEGCNYACVEDSSQYGKKNTLDEGSPCEQLDGICYENNWALPEYRASTSEGGYKATVTLQGNDMECTREGEVCVNPRLARDSAAAQVIKKLRSF